MKSKETKHRLKNSLQQQGAAFSFSKAAIYMDYGKNA